MCQSDVTEFTCRGEALCPKRLPDPSLRVVGTMKVEVHPPNPVVIVKVVIQVPRVSADRKRADFHGVERYSHTTPRESLVGRDVRPAHICRERPAPYTPPLLLQVRLADRPAVGQVTRDAAYFPMNIFRLPLFNESSSCISRYDAICLQRPVWRAVERSVAEMMVRRSSNSGSNQRFLPPPSVQRSRDRTSRPG